MSACWWLDAKKPVRKHCCLGGHLWGDDDDDDDDDDKSPDSSGITPGCRADAVFHYQW